MKTAIFFVLACLFGYTVADGSTNCTAECTGIANTNLGVVTIDGGVSIAVDIELQVVASIGAKYGFIVYAGTDIRIIIHKDSNSVLYINGNSCVYITSTQVNVIFTDVTQFTAAIKIIKSACEGAGSDAKATFNFSVLLQKSATIDYSLLITGNANVQLKVKTNFDAALIIVKGYIAQLSSGSITINVFIAVCFDTVVSANVDLVEAFDLILQAGGKVEVIINVLIVAYSNKQLTILIAVLKIGDSVQYLSEYKVIFLTLNIGGRDRNLILVYGRGNFYLKYYTVGDSSSTITLIVNKDKSLICISNSIIGYTLIIVGDIRILFCHTTGVGVIFNSSRVAIVTAVAVGVKVQGAAVSETVLIAFAVSSSATTLVQSGVTISVFVKACASGSSDALVSAFSSVQASVVIVVYQTFGKLFASFNSIFFISINLGTIATICLISSSASSVVSAFGGAIAIFVSSITVAINFFATFYTACSAALTILFNVQINFGGSVSVG